MPVLLFQIVQMIATAVIDFFTLMLLARFFMQWQRVSFRSQIGAFVITVTDWVVLPLRRVIPGLFGLDLASLVPAWLAQTVLVMVNFLLLSATFVGWGVLLPGALGLGLIGLGVMIVWLICIVVIASAILSWFGPHLPAAYILNALTRPFLAPFRRVVPPIAGVDLSPLVLLLLLQILLMVFEQIRSGFVQFLLVH
ncbi:membrane protein [Betaproteobacteria bacterium]|nr:membrane protein [Betaproteobacteria bacterium]